MPMPKEKTKKQKDFDKKTVLLYAPPKTGKSTTAANLYPNGLFFATEAGHKELEIFKWQKEVTDKETGEKTLEDPTSWEDFKKCVLEFTQQKEFSCLIIDTVDNLFHWCAKYVNRKHDIAHESDLGFGKGYSFIKDEFHSAINYLTQKGYGVCFISHSAMKEKELGHKRLTCTDTTLPATAQKVIHGLCDYIFYAYVDLEGKRWIRTKGTETINAGDRSGRLPEVLPLDATILRQELVRP